MGVDTTTLTVNGVRRVFSMGSAFGQVPYSETLLETLRDRLGLTGAKRACDEGACGCCTVIKDGEAVPSCMLLTADCDGAEITTLEGLADPVLHYNEDETTVVEADSVLMAAGQQVDLSFLGDYASARGRLVVDGESQATSHKGVYAGGDIVSGPSTVISAIRQGRNAAEAINASAGIARPEYRHEGFLKFDPAFSELHRGVKDQSIPVEERTLEREDSVTVSREAAEAEARRCMNCGCYSVNASDLSPVLVALGATVKTTKREIAAAALFTEQLKVKDKLEPDEIVTEVSIPVTEGAVTHYDKFRLRDSVDFAMVSLASSYELDDGKIKSASLVFGGVAPVPLRREAAERYLVGREPDEETAQEAARLALEGVAPFEKNAYKVQVAQTLVKQSVLRLRG